MTINIAFLALPKTLASAAMKSVLACFLLFCLFPMSLFGQQGSELLPIELVGKRVFYAGSVVKKTSELESIISKADNEEASLLIKKHKSNAQVGTVLGWTGVGISAVGLIIQVNSFSESDIYQLQEKNNQGYAIVLGGSALTLLGTLIASGSWKKNGKRAVDLYNQAAIEANDHHLSFQIAPSDQSIGLKLGIKF